MRTGRPTSRSTRAHRLGVIVALCAYCLSIFGFPLPAAAPRKEADQPFPCQNHPCGCQTAEQCWRHCCCFTPEERWAWARAHGVQPPAYAERPACSGWRTTPLRAQAETKAPAADCACCSAHHEPPPPPPPPGSNVRWVLGVSALGCQGFSTFWIGSAAALPPVAAVAWNPERGFAETLGHPESRLCFLRHTPPVPPPR